MLGLAYRTPLLFGSQGVHSNSSLQPSLAPAAARCVLYRVRTPAILHSSVSVRGSGCIGGSDQAGQTAHTASGGSY